MDLRGIKMILRDLGATVLFALIVGAIVVGIGSRFVTKEEDHFVEEHAENVIETTLENLLGLDDDHLDGVIDLTPGSKEDK